MNIPSSEKISQLARQAAEPIGRLASSDVLVRAKDGIATLVRRYPASTVLGAFAVGFALARLFRGLSED
jgi:hypothetical protein